MRVTMHRQIARRGERESIFSCNRNVVKWLIKAGIFKERKLCKGGVREFCICRAKKKLVRRGNEALRGEQR